MADIIDEIASETRYTPPKKEEEYRPSSYNPLYSYPENLWHDVKESGKSIVGGLGRMREGHYLGGAFEAGMGALRAPFTPLEAGVQTATYPLADATGLPEWALTGVGMLAAPAGYARLAGRLGGAARGAAEAAPSAARLEGPDIRLLPSPGRPMPGGASAFGEGPPSRFSGKYDPLSEYGEQYIRPSTRGVREDVAPTVSMPDVSGATRYPALEQRSGYQGMGPRPVAGYLERPAIRLPDERPKWGAPQYESGIPMRDLRSPWGKPAPLSAEEMMFGGRRMMPSQQLPDYTTGAFGRRAAEHSARMRAEEEALKSHLNWLGEGYKKIPYAAREEPQFARQPQLQDLPLERQAKQIAAREPRPSEIRAKEERAGQLRATAEAEAARTRNIEDLLNELKPSRKLTAEELSGVRASELKRDVASRQKLPVTEGPTKAATKYNQAVNKAEALVRTNLAQHGFVNTGVYTMEGLKELLTFGGESHQVVSLKNADRIIKDWLKKGIVTTIDIGGEPHYLIKFEAE